MNAKSVSLINVSKVFDDYKAVTDVNLKIEKGEFVTLLGPSGCGKTTTLRMIAGFEDVTSGEILIGEENVKTVPPNKRNCTMVFQSYALFPHLNVWDNISYGLKIKKLSKDAIDKKVSEVLEIMNLKEYKDRIPSQLSGGQQQRVALARAIVMEPSVLLFDEPLSNLDAKLRHVMRDEIRRIQKEIGITAIYVTHDQSEAMSMSDQIIVMNAGRIEQKGTPQEIYHQPVSEFIADFIGIANFFEGKVVGVQDGKLKLETVFGIIEGRDTGKYKINDLVTVMIRPEAIELTKDENNIGVVTKSVFMGQTQEYEVMVKDQTIKVSQSNPYQAKVYDVGESVNLTFLNKILHVI